MSSPHRRPLNSFTSVCNLDRRTMSFENFRNDPRARPRVLSRTIVPAESRFRASHSETLSAETLSCEIAHAGQIKARRKQALPVTLAH